MSMTYSLNGRFIVEPYQSDNQIKASNAAGFSMIKQKVSLVGLTLMADVLGKSTDIYVNSTTPIADGVNPILAKKGSTVWIREELLFTQEWAKKIYECKGIEGKFIIVEPQYVDLVTAAV